MRRYTPESKRDFDIINVKLNSGLAVVFRPLPGEQMVIEIRQNDEPICSPSHYSYERLRQWLTQLALQCGIIKMGLRLPGMIIATELEDDFVLALARTTTGFYASVSERGQTVGHPTFLPLERAVRIIEAVAEVTGPPDSPSEADDSDEPDDSGEPNLNLN